MASCRSSVNPFGHSMQQPVNCYFEYEQLTWTLHENKTPVDFTRVYSQKHPVLNWIPSQKSVGLEHSQRILSCIRDMVCAWQMFLSASSSQMGAQWHGSPSMGQWSPQVHSLRGQSCPCHLGRSHLHRYQHRSKLSFWLEAGNLEPPFFIPSLLSAKVTQPILK